jgi:hypothetical protein
MRPATSHTIQKIASKREGGSLAKGWLGYCRGTHLEKQFVLSSHTRLIIQNIKCVCITPFVSDVLQEEITTTQSHQISIILLHLSRFE